MITPHGVGTVARQEFEVRIRAGRWRWLLGLWFVLLFILTALAHAALRTTDIAGNALGTPLFGLLMLLILGLLLLVVPSLTAQSVNGDRERGTLATMQVTLLSASEIAVGKLLAAWATAMVFLLLSLPMVLWAMISGGAPFVRVIATMGIVALLIAVVCSICQGLSAIFSRSTTSSVISYIVIFGLTIGTLIAFTLATALTSESRTSRYTDFEGTIQSSTYQQSRPDRVWWIIAPNPFVILGDAAPALPLVPAKWDPKQKVSPEGDVLGSIGEAVRSIRVRPQANIEFYSGSEVTQPEKERRSDAVWPWGLAFNVALGLVFLLITIRRLQTPAHKLGRGVRVA